MQVKYKILGGMEFAQALQKLASTPMSTKHAIRVQRLISALGEAREEISKEYNEEIVEKFADRDEAGNFKPADREGLPFGIKEGMHEEFVQAARAFDQKVAEVDTPKLFVTGIQEIKLSPRDIDALSPILAEFDKPEAAKLEIAK